MGIDGSARVGRQPEAEGSSGKGGSSADGGPDSRSGECSGRGKTGRGGVYNFFCSSSKLSDTITLEIRN
ncbi:MAG: hypothetical protein HY454_03775 [Parcubacteria group bacterium]|nr:hypothetical protein [Parcubacteria group bacterium]